MDTPMQSRTASRRGSMKSFVEFKRPDMEMNLSVKRTNLEKAVLVFQRLVDHALSYAPVTEIEAWIGEQHPNFPTQHISASSSKQK